MSVPLDPRAIEEEIARIRERESNPFLSGSRTNLFNLVVFSRPVAGAGGGVSPAIDFLLGKRPARIITIEETTDPDTSVFVSGRCSPDARNRGVCFEEIKIQSGTDHMGADPGAWAPLLIRDLPVYLLWLDRLSIPRPADVSTETAGGPRPADVSIETAGGPRPADVSIETAGGPALLQQAEELVDKLIIDSMRLENSGEDPIESLDALRVLHEETHGAMTVSDLNWDRTLPMRLHTARLFNPEDHRQRLTAISRVRLEGGSRGEGILFFFWLAARLEWSVETGPAGSLRFTDAQGRRVEVVHVDVFPLSKGFRAGFAFFDGGAELSISCSKNGCAAVGDERGVYRFIDEGTALLREVDTLKQDPVLLDVLDCIGKSRHA